VLAEHSQKLCDIPARLDAAGTIEDIVTVPGFRLHPLKGEIKASLLLQFEPIGE
jgi:hypothetical protein